MCVGGLESTVSNLFLDSFLWYKLLEGRNVICTNNTPPSRGNGGDRLPRQHQVLRRHVCNKHKDTRRHVRGLGVTHQRDVAATVLSRGSRDNSITRGHQSGAALLPGGSFQWPARDVICDEDGVVGYVQG